MAFQFFNEKTTQALNFFAREAGGSISKIRALKLIYLADRYHLRLNNRPITGDTYYAMRLGPVPSQAKDLAENKITDNEVRNYNEKYIRPESKKRYKSLADMDWDALAETEVDALKWAWANFEKYKDDELIDYVHRYPEWKKHRAQIRIKPKSRILMSYLDFLKDAPAGTEPCHIMTQAERTFLEDYIKDLQGPTLIPA